MTRELLIKDIPDEVYDEMVEIAGAQTNGDLELLGLGALVREFAKHKIPVNATHDKGLIEQLKEDGE